MINPISLRSYILAPILMDSLRLVRVSEKKKWARFARGLWYEYARSARVFFRSGRSRSYDVFRRADGVQ